MRDWVTNVETTHYVLGSARWARTRTPRSSATSSAGSATRPRPSWPSVEGRLPDMALACVGGGSNAIGLLARFIGEPSVRLAVAEAAGDGVETGRHAAAIVGGTPGILHGSRSLMLQDRDGQVVEAHSASAGLDYPGDRPAARGARRGRPARGRHRDRPRGRRGDEDDDPRRGHPAGARDRARDRGPAQDPRRARGRRAAVGRRGRRSCSGSPGAATRTSRRSSGSPTSSRGTRRGDDRRAARVLPLAARARTRRRRGATPSTRATSRSG